MQRILSRQFLKKQNSAPNTGKLFASKICVLSPALRRLWEGSPVLPQIHPSLQPRSMFHQHLGLQCHPSDSGTWICFLKICRLHRNKTVHGFHGLTENARFPPDTFNYDLATTCFPVHFFSPPNIIIR